MFNKSWFMNTLHSTMTKELNEMLSLSDVICERLVQIPWYAWKKRRTMKAWLDSNDSKIFLYIITIDQIRDRINNDGNFSHA